MRNFFAHKVSLMPNTRPPASSKCDTAAVLSGERQVALCKKSGDMASGYRQTLDGTLRNVLRKVLCSRGTVLRKRQLLTGCPRFKVLGTFRLVLNLTISDNAFEFCGEDLEAADVLQNDTSRRRSLSFSSTSAEITLHGSSFPPDEVKLYQKMFFAVALVYDGCTSSSVITALDVERVFVPILGRRSIKRRQGALETPIVSPNLKPAADCIQSESESEPQDAQPRKLSVGETASEERQDTSHNLKLLRDLANRCQNTPSICPAPPSTDSTDATISRPRCFEKKMSERSILFVGLHRSGKTTLLNQLFGPAPSDSGTVRFEQNLIIVDGPSFTEKQFGSPQFIRLAAYFDLVCVVYQGNDLPKLQKGLFLLSSIMGSNRVLAARTMCDVPHHERILNKTEGLGVRSEVLIPRSVQSLIDTDYKMLRHAVGKPLRIFPVSGARALRSNKAFKQCLLTGRT